MQVTEITNEQKLQLVDKYLPHLMKRFLKASEEAGYKTPEVVEEFKILDEILCQCQEADFMDGLIESIEDAITMEEYGFELTETGDEEE